MCGILNFQLLRVNPKIDEFLLYTISTKTQFSNPETHQKIILLLDYISSKYLNEFDCVDEGKYWETRNMTLLIENFNRNGQIINRFISSIECIPQNKEENLEDYLKRIAFLTHKRIQNE